MYYPHLFPFPSLPNTPVSHSLYVINNESYAILVLYVPFYEDANDLEPMLKKRKTNSDESYSSMGELWKREGGCSAGPSN